MIVIQRLDRAELVEEACALLYKVYYDEAAWRFSVNNASQLRVEVSHNRKVLVDRFTDKAIWFGALDDSQLVGCARLTLTDENNKLEMESYPNSWIIQRYLPTDKSHCTELTRTAIAPNYRDRGIVRHLFLSIFQYCEDHQYSVCATPNNGYIVKLLKEIGWPLKMEMAFKYEEHDQSPVNFHFANYAKSEVKNVILNLASYKTNITPNHAKILDALEITAPILPTPVYWHDTKGVVLGINANCLKAIGATRDIIGKTPYEFYPKEVAEHVLTHNEQVIKTGEILWQDEPMRDVTTGETKIFRSIKAPLHDDDGKIIGIIGSSVEVTAEKEAERLKIENEKQRALLKEEAKFTKIANQVAHDIRSPVASLLMIVKSCTQIPEATRIALREAAIGIGDIANHLLNQYQKTEAWNNDSAEKRQPIFVSALLLQLLNEKKHQYAQLSIELDCQFQQKTQFAFIKIEPSRFKRMVSNLINNAVDAFDAKPGKIELLVTADNEWLQIIIKDNGKGIPEEVLTKIKSKIAVTTGKTEGHGIGFSQIWETLADNQGELTIDSALHQGTKVALTFPRIKAPSWIAEEIILGNDDIVVIVDDDPSTHGAWDARFERILSAAPTVRLAHFQVGQKAIEFITNLPVAEQKKVFLLTDYELLKQDFDGLRVVTQSHTERSILVTSHYADSALQQRAAKTGTKILPKQLASEISIKIQAMIQPTRQENELSYVDAVIVDDNELFVESLLNFAFSEKTAAKYHSPENFLVNVHKYAKDTKIYLDNNYKLSHLTGLILAEKLHKKGYQNLYLLSGEAFSDGIIPDYLRLIKKDDIENLKNS